MCYIRNLSVFALVFAVGDAITFDHYYFGKCSGVIGRSHFGGREFFVKDVKCGEVQPGNMWLEKWEIKGKL